MSPPSVSSTGGRLGEVIAGYLQALERGESPDRAALLAANPDLATELQAYFVNLDQIERAVAPLRLEDPILTTGVNGETDPRPLIRYFGDYELEVEIARGGMGVVYRARQKSLNRPVALKMILAGQLASAADVQRFRQEAEAAANLDHPHILPVYEVGEHEGRQYFAMKLIEGGSLATKTRVFRNDPRAAAELLVGLARAVHFAHQRGTLHRDLKPANVLLDVDGTPYIADFGLAKRADGGPGLTHTGAVIGTPSYMPPEQARGEKGLTVAVDVYSLGAILYELLAGQPPFRAETTYETIKQVMEIDPPDPRVINSAANPDLSAIALKCLAKDPASRYSSAAELADDLDRWLAGEPTRARPPSLIGLATRWLRRNATAAATVVSLGVAWGVLTGLLIFVRDGDARPAVRHIHMLATAEAWFNPIGWAQRIGWDPVARWLVVAAAASIWLGVGWLLRAGARPRSPAAALGVAAATGLLASWVCNLFVTPMVASTMRVQLYKIYAEEPPTWRVDPDGTRFRLTLPDIDILHPDLKTLEKYVPPENRDPTQKENAPAYSRAHYDLMEANRIHRAAAGVWLTQLFTLVFFMIAALSAGWAADFLVRSGRGWAGRTFGYLELYGAAMAVPVTAVLLVAFLQIAAEPEKHLNAPPVEPFVSLFVGAIVSALVAYLGVLRGWHPVLRTGIYLLVVGTNLTWLYQTF